MEYKTLEKRLIGTEKINSVLASELHSRLEVKTKFTDWLNNKLVKGLFDERTDYVIIYGTFNETKFQVSDFEGTVNQAKAKHLSKNAVLTLDTAKELSMMENTLKGKESRQYFISVEKVAKNILGDEKLKFELKKMDLEYETAKVENGLHIETLMVTNKIKQLASLKDLGISFDPSSLIDTERLKSVLPKDIAKAMTLAASEIRVGVRVFSATHLLRSSNVNINPRDFNSMLLQVNILEEYTYKQSVYKRFIDTNNFYGYNLPASSINKNPSSTMYYDDRFMSLITLLRNQGLIDE